MNKYKFKNKNTKRFEIIINHIFKLFLNNNCFYIFNKIINKFYTKIKL